MALHPKIQFQHDLEVFCPNFCCCCCCLVLKTLQGSAANMDSKILVYKWPLIKCKIWYMNESIFKIFPNLSQNWLKWKKFLENLGDFAQNLVQIWSNWYMNWSLFLEKLVFVWVYFQILLRRIPTKTKLESPPQGYLLPPLNFIPLQEWACHQSKMH